MQLNLDNELCFKMTRATMYAEIGGTSSSSGAIAGVEGVGRKYSTQLGVAEVDDAEDENGAAAFEVNGVKMSLPVLGNSVSQSSIGRSDG